MRNKQPIIQIDKFSGAGQNGIIYCEGLYPEVDNQKSVMGEGFTTSNVFNTSTAGFTNLGAVYGSVALSTINSSNETYNLYVDSGVYQRIFAYQTIGDTIKDGVIHLSPTVNYCKYPDLIETTLGNILFPSERYIGRGVRFKATGGSTTTIVDTTKDFVALGYAIGDKVTNLKTGIEYTITTVSTNTLTFSASGSNTTSANDECIAWQDDRFDTNITKASWQVRQTDWVKQFKQYGDIYYFTNGNYIGKIEADESAVDADFKPLPSKHQAVALSVNNAKILVSANYNGRGVILLWDGASDGWNNSIKFDIPITSLIEYNSGWIFVSQGSVYFTDGWQLQKLYDINQSIIISSFNLTSASHNGLIINNDLLYCVNSADDNNLLNRGIYVINLNNVNDGFTMFKPIVATKPNGFSYSIFINNRFAGFNTIEVGGGGYVSRISSGVSSLSYQDKSMILMVSLPDTLKISGIGLNLSRYIKNYDQDYIAALSRNIQVSIGDGNRGLISYATTKSLGSPTSTFVIDGTQWINNEIGDQIYIRDRDEATYAERTFITGITGKGTNTETWGISPALSTTHGDGTEMKIIKVKSLDKKTVNYNQLKDEVFFFTSSPLFTNKLFIEIVLFSGANSMPINIHEINVYE